MYYEEIPDPQTLQAKKRKKQQQTTMLVALILIGGLAYYFLGYLPEEKNRVKGEIEEDFKENYAVLPEKLDKTLWEEKETWEEHLNSLFLPSQVIAFGERMLRAIEKRAEEIEQEEKDKPRKAREEAVQSIEKFAEKELTRTPSLKDTIEKFKKKINNTHVNDLSSVIDEANKFITQQKNKRQKLHWLRKPENWADKKLEILQQEFDQAWNQLNGIVNPHKEPDKEPEKCTFAASYTINFPPSLWNDLSEEEKNHERAKELELRNEVQSYKFNNKINYWYDKVVQDPTRGERDESNIDNNATLYGAPRTGKSIIVEKLAYEVDKYPLVIIQGSALTPTINDQKCSIDNFKKFIFTICDINNTLMDDFGFEREGNGEPRYIFFIDEANQVSENTFARKSSYLTFLKECMGSDNYKENESWNLWIAATNYLNQLDEAVYQPGRLANRLSFSWTLGDFKGYAEDAGIISDFPEHWKNATSLSEEDNKWVNRFNVIHFENSFLGRKIGGGHIDNAVPFWDKFISHEENKKILNEEKETNQQGEEIIKKKGIQLGEFIQFFWNKFDSNELYDDDFDAKFSPPREPKIEQVIGESAKIVANKISEDISKAIETRLKELNQTARDTKTVIQNGQNNMASTINRTMEEVKNRLQEIGRNMGSSGRRSPPWYS